jgi:hypothetical protein
MSDKYKVLGSSDSDWLNAHLPDTAAYCIPVGLGGKVLVNAPRLLTHFGVIELGGLVEIDELDIVGLWLPGADRYVGIDSEKSEDSKRWTDDDGEMLSANDSRRVLGWLRGLVDGQLDDGEFKRLAGSLAGLKDNSPPFPSMHGGDGDWTDDPGDEEE